MAISTHPLIRDFCPDPGSRNPHPLPTYGTYFRQDLRHPAGRRISKAAGSREPAYLRVTRYRDLGDGRRHMATGMHGSEPAEDIVVDALRSTRYHVSPSRGDCRDACAIRSDLQACIGKSVGGRNKKGRVKGQMIINDTGRWRD